MHNVAGDILSLHLGSHNTKCYCIIKFNTFEHWPTCIKNDAYEPVLMALQSKVQLTKGEFINVNGAYAQAI